MHTHVPLASVKISYPSNKIKVEKPLLENKTENKTFCVGEDASSKHPKVYLSMQSGVAKCTYCGIIFKK